MTSDLADLSAVELLDAYRRGVASPVEATRACLARIERLNGTFGAFTRVDGEAALAAARASEARWRAARPSGAIDGVPVTVKDLILVAGWPTRRGSLSTAGEPPAAADAPAVARLRAAGAVLLGKTTTPEFGWKGVTDNPCGEVARNPWDPAATAGGSSGGAAVAATLGMGALHLGSDGGGSIRIPAGFSGIVGLKPTFGRVPAWPASPFGTLAHLGPMTRTVADAALMLTVMAGPHPRDWLALPDAGADYGCDLESGLRGLRIAYSPTLGHARVEAEVRAAVDRAVQRLGELGAAIEEVDPGFASPLRLFERLWYPGAALVVAGIAPSRRAALDPGLRRVAALGNRMRARDLQAALKERAELAIHMELFFERFDLLATPTLPLTAFAALRDAPGADAGGDWVEWTPFSYPFNLTQQPAISAPCGRSTAGLPIGLQLVARKYADALVLRAARAAETFHPFTAPPVVG